MNDLVRLRINLLALLEHLDKLPNAPSGRLRLLGRLNSEENGVSISPVQRGKESLRASVSVQGNLQIIGHSRNARRIVRPIPAAILFGALNLRKTARLHTGR